MTNQKILEIAMKQSAADLNCRAEEFLKNEPVVVSGGIGPGAKKYYQEPVSAALVSYGNNIVASVKEAYREIIEEYLHKFTFYHCFETPNMHWLEERLRKEEQSVCFMAEYYLPDIKKVDPLPCEYSLKILYQEDFAELYRPEWSNALCKERKQLDILGVGAYDGKKLVGLAGCSADCENMWQIGIDVLPEYRKKGIASALTSRLAAEILERDKVPFYCSAWSNIRSVRNGIRSGFIPAGVEMTVKPFEIVQDMNRQQK